jgi:hypothetical protein
LNEFAGKIARKLQEKTAGKIESKLQADRKGGLGAARFSEPTAAGPFAGKTPNSRK